MTTRNKILAYFFLVILCAILLRIVGTPIYRRLFLPKEETVVPFDTAAAYPFSEPQQSYSSSHSSIPANWLHKIKSFVTDRTSATSDYLSSLVLGMRIADKLMGLDLTASITAGENNPNDGIDVAAVFESDYYGFILDDTDISTSINHLIAFKEQMQLEGRNLLFLMVPSKWAQTPAFPDYSVPKYAEALTVLQENGFDFIDMEEEIRAQGLDKASLFFKTDHHWLPSSGIWADRLVSEFMNEHYDYAIDSRLFMPDHYVTTIIPHFFLGSVGKKATAVYCEPEDFPVVLPKYDTDLDVFISENNAVQRGDMRDTLFAYDCLWPEPYILRYAFYGHGEQALIRVHNNEVQDGHRVLMLKASFADCMSPYLAAGLENLDIIDLRYFKGSLQTFIHETNPDTILFVYGISSFQDTQLFDFR